MSALVGEFDEESKRKAGSPPGMEPDLKKEAKTPKSRLPTPAKNLYEGDKTSNLKGKSPGASAVNGCL